MFDPIHVRLFIYNVFARPQILENVKTKVEKSGNKGSASL